MPTAEGTDNGRMVEVLRDTGCTCCIVKRSLVSDDHLIGKESYVTLIDATTQRYLLAVIDVDCPFFTEENWLLCMEDTLYDLVMGQNFLICHTRLLLGLGLSKARRHIGNLRFLIRLFMKLRRLWSRPRLRIQNWIVLDVELNLRTLPCVVEAKFVQKKDLMYRKFIKGNKLTLQLVVPKISVKTFWD